MLLQIPKYQKNIHVKNVFAGSENNGSHTKYHTNIVPNIVKNCKKYYCRRRERWQSQSSPSSFAGFPSSQCKLFPHDNHHLFIFINIISKIIIIDCIGCRWEEDSDRLVEQVASLLLQKVTLKNILCKLRKFESVSSHP